VDDERGVISLELKYCESCGGLWARPRGLQIVDCHACQEQSGNFVFRRKNAVAARMKPPENGLTDFCRAGGRA